MLSLKQGPWMAAALGTVLITFSNACSDAPSSPWPSTQRPEAEVAVAATADLPARADVPLVPMPGEMVTRREFRARDGQRYLIETVRGPAGQPRAVRVTQAGHLVARLLNEWRDTGDGYVLERQHLARFADGQLIAVMDSRTDAVASPVVAAPFTLPHGMAASGVQLRERVRALEGDVAIDGGPCDKEAAKVEEAIDDWLLSVVAVGAAVVAKNPQAAWTAYAYQVTMYRDMTRAEAALDTCVENAGKPEYGL